MIPWKWNGDRRFERHNSPRRIRAHFLRCFNLHSFQGDGVSLGGNPHDRGHTGR